MEAAEQSHLADRSTTPLRAAVARPLMAGVGRTWVGQITRYDPEIAPDPVEWLAATEADRLAAVRRHHRSARHHAGNPQLHAVIHVAVETQLAERHSATTDAMNRLVADGLGRHEALHAIGSVVAAEMFDIVKSRRPHDPEAYSRKLRELTAAAWRTSDAE